MTPEKGKVATLLGKSFDTELIEERKSFQHGILMFAYKELIRISL